tara:strand:- start:966 stop:1133 length:168 start_codon:yes stop_codon:yes gene_type:complete
MDEATEYKRYLEALRKARESVQADKEKQKEKPKVQKLSCGGMGIAIRGGNFKGVK